MHHCHKQKGELKVAGGEEESHMIHTERMEEREEEEEGLLGKMERLNRTEMQIRGNETKGGMGCVLNIKCIISFLPQMLLIYLGLRQLWWSDKSNKTWWENDTEDFLLCITLLPSRHWITLVYTSYFFGNSLLTPLLTFVPHLSPLCALSVRAARLKCQLFPPVVNRNRGQASV